MRSRASLCAGCVWCFLSTSCRVTWSIEAGDEFGYKNVITAHFASTHMPQQKEGIR
jgi:hypothetical protein